MVTCGSMRAMLLALGAEFALDDQVGLAESVFHVADFFQNISGKVVLGVVDARGIRLIMNHRRAVGHGLLNFQDGRQNFILDFNEPQRLLGDGAALRRNGRHAVTHQAHLRVEQIGVVRRRLRPALTGGGVGHARNIFVGQDGVHARKRLGFAVCQSA